MRLEIDAGNTFIKWRWVGDGYQSATLRLLKEKFFDEWIQLESQNYPETLREIWIGSVAGDQFNDALAERILRSFGVTPKFAKTTQVASGVTNSYSDPERMGVDRWLAMLAARCQDEAPAIIVDCGSAITVDYLDSVGRHEGGYILPGLQMMRATLLRNTAYVRYDETDQEQLKPGKSTGACVNNGTRFLLSALGHELAGQSGYQIYITGGDGDLLHKDIPGSLLIPDLVLDGLLWAEKQ